MRKILLATAMLGVLGLGACGQTATSTTVTGTTPSATTTTSTNPLQALNTFTNADLTNAIGVATKAGPAGQPVVTCFTFLQNQLANLQSAVTVPGGTVGAATAFTVAYLGLNTATSITSPGSQLAYDEACGPLAVSLINQGLTLTQQVQNLALLVAKVP